MKIIVVYSYKEKIHISKNNSKLLICATAWINLKKVTPRKQPQKTDIVQFHLHENQEQVILTDEDERILVPPLNGRYY